jgi:hypothetical protein
MKKKIKESGVGVVNKAPSAGELAFVIGIAVLIGLGIAYAVGVFESVTKGACFKNELHFNTYAKVKYKWSFNWVDYHYVDASDDQGEVYRERSLSSFKEAYPEKVDCSVYEVAKYQGYLRHLDKRMGKVESEQSWQNVKINVQEARLLDLEKKKGK